MCVFGVCCALVGVGVDFCLAPVVSSCVNAGCARACVCERGVNVVVNDFFSFFLKVRKLKKN